MTPAWIVIGLVVLAFPAASSGEQRCSVNPSGDTEWELRCPTFSVYLQRNSDQLQVRCIDKPDFELLRTIPGLPRLTFSSLDYSLCPMPTANQSLVDTLSAFLDRKQLSGITKLYFVGNAKYSEAVPLEPALFADLPKLEVLSLKRAAVLALNNSQLFEHLPHLAFLDLREGDGGPHVAGLLLRPLQNLTTLELMENGLTEIPDGLVSELPNLTSVNLYKNKLQRLDKLLGLPALSQIELYDNQLTELHEDVFSELPALSELVLGLNKLASLPGGLLRKNYNLVKFSASQQESERLVLGDGLFAGLTKLEHVMLNECQITELPDGLFAGTTALKSLDLSDNKLRTLPETLLHDASSLTELHLSNNELWHSLPDALFQGTHQLRVLDLAHNQLVALNRNLLSSNTKLKSLYLQHNQLHMIDTQAFKDQSNSLETLNLSHNRVALHVNGTAVMYQNGKAFYVNQTPFSYLNILTTLDLSHNEIITVFSDFSIFMPNLINLNLAHNRITKLNVDNRSFLSQSLEVVNLQWNKITQIDSTPLNSTQQHNMRNGTGKPVNILLDDNPLNCDCRMHALVHLLRSGKPSFLLEGAQCAEPPKLSHYSVYSLVPTDLICQLTPADKFCPSECTCYKRPADNVLIVNCNDQNLSVAPTIPSPAMLSGEGYRAIKLNLANNRLQELAMVGEGWNSVQQLMVANNNLTELPYDTLPGQLKFIDASGNQLRLLDPQLVQVLASRPELRRIRLSANPWHCACDEPLLQFVSDNVARIEDFSELRCADGQPINSGTQKALCHYRTVLIVVLSVVITSLAIAGLILYWLYTRYQHEIKVWLFKHDRLRWLVAEEQIDQDKRYDAFISYSHKDEDFIVSTLMPTLEGAPMNFKLCWHVRDFMPGELISGQITKAVEESRRTIIVLSPNYIESVWGQMEFNTAYLQSVADKRNRVIPIIYEEIGNIETLDAELRAYLKTNTYVRWDDPWFWDKLRYAMPHPRRIKGAQASNNLRMASIDKLNLLQTATQQSTPSLESTPPIEHVPSGRGAPNGEPLTMHSSVPPFTISSGMFELPIAAK